MALVVTEEEGCTLSIGGVTVRVDSCRGRKVRLAIDAPKEDVILRSKHVRDKLMGAGFLLIDDRHWASPHGDILSTRKALLECESKK